MKFSTQNEDNDNDSGKSCSQAYHGAWWYNAVTILILTGSTWKQLQMTPNQMRGTIGKINKNL